MSYGRHLLLPDATLPPDTPTAEAPNILPHHGARLIPVLDALRALVGG